MKEKKSFSHDIIVAVFLLAASTFLMYNAFTVMSPEARQFPVIILVFFIALSAAMLFMGIKDSMAAKNQEIVFHNLKWETVKFPLLVFVIITLYVVAVDIIGFIIPSLILPPALMCFNYERKITTLVGVPVGLVAFLYVLFTFILKTKLP